MVGPTRRIGTAYLIIKSRWNFNCSLEYIISIAIEIISLLFFNFTHWKFFLYILNIEYWILNTLKSRRMYSYHKYTHIWSHIFDLSFSNRHDLFRLCDVNSVTFSLYLEQNWYFICIFFLFSTVFKRFFNSIFTFFLYSRYLIEIEKNNSTLKQKKRQKQ